MPMGTSENQPSNQRMGASPVPPQPDNRGQERGNPPPNPEHRTPASASRPGAAYSDYPQQRDPMFDDPQRRDPSHRHDHAAASTAWDERLRNPSEPWLPDDYDRALVARVYQDVDSGDELRRVAYEAANEVYRMAAESVASVDVPIPGVEDQRDPRTKAREGQRPGVQRAQRPNMPMQGNPDNRPEQTTPPDQPPGPQDIGGTPPGHGGQNPGNQQQQDRERHERERHQREEEHRRHREEQQKKREEEQNKPK